MSGDESSDGLEGLQELLSVYKSEESPKQTKSKSNRKKNDKIEPTYVEVPMEKVVFGDKQRLLTNLAKAVGKKLEEYDSDKEEKEESNKRTAAWSDSDDEDLQVGDVKRLRRNNGAWKNLTKDKSYKEFLQARFERTIHEPKWASLDKNKSADSDSDDEPLLKTVGFIDRKNQRSQLNPKRLEYRRKKDLNWPSYSEGAIKSIQFHPTSTVALVAGTSCVATIYSVDGHTNEKLHSVRFRGFPIASARIAPCGTRAYFSSSNAHFYYSYDLLEAKSTKLKLPKNVHSFNQFEISPCGKYIAAIGSHGAIHLYTSASNELLHTFKQEGNAKGLCFTADSKRLLVNGQNINVSILSLRQRSIEHSFIDDGCIYGRALALSPNQRMLATGSNEGVVNVYDYESVFASANPMPEKRFMNLLTAITDVRFNHTSELLAMCSKEAPNALKMAHFPSASVYANFPGVNNKIGNITTLAFSPHSHYMAAGNSDKKVKLFSLDHFKNY